MTPIGLNLLAQDDVSGITSILFWSGVLLGFLLLGYYGYGKLKRWVNQPDDSASAVGFTLSDLRDLHRQGKISDAEYETARLKMVAAAKRMTESLPPVFSRPTKPPVDPPAASS